MNKTIRIKPIFIILLFGWLIQCMSCVSTPEPAPAKESAPIKTGKTDKIRITAVRTYGAFEDPKQSERVYTNKFNKEDTTYIWIELYVENLQYKKKQHEHDITWIWLNSDGSQRGKMGGKFVIKPEWKNSWTSRGWGWDIPGNWPVGTYNAVVQIDGIEVGRNSFSVNSSKGYFSGIVPSYPGAKIISADKCPKGAGMCGTKIEIYDTKQKAFNYYRSMLVQNGWKMDTALSSNSEKGTLGEKALWGIINCNKEKLTLTVLFPSYRFTKGKANQVSFNLMDRGASKGMADFIKNIARYGGSTNNRVKKSGKPPINQMNQKFKYSQWSVTIKDATNAGNPITKTRYFNSSRPYRFEVDSSGTHLLRVKIDLERNDGKPIKKTFMTDVKVRDAYGREYSWIGAGTEYGKYFDRRKADMQSLLMPVQPKSIVEYVFQVPDNAQIRELIWMDQYPIGIVVK